MCVLPAHPVSGHACTGVVSLTTNGPGGTALSVLTVFHELHYMLNCKSTVDLDPGLSYTLLILITFMEY